MNALLFHSDDISFTSCILVIRLNFASMKVKKPSILNTIDSLYPVKKNPQKTHLTKSVKKINERKKCLVIEFTELLNRRT